MQIISEHLRRLAGEIKGRFHAQQIRIFFWAPDPDAVRRRTEKGIPAPKNEVLDDKGANFKWQNYRLNFTVTGGTETNYYIYELKLNSNGTKQEPGRGTVYESDSKWALNNLASKIPTDALKPEEVEVAFPFLKKPELYTNKRPAITLVYINSNEPEGVGEYSGEAFKLAFDQAYYVVLDTKSGIKKNPFSETTGLDVPEKEEK